PGAWEHFERPAVAQAAPAKNPFAQFLDNVPESLLKPLADNNVLGVIMIALAFGVALRRMPQHERQTVEDLFRLAFGALVIVLHWVIDRVPLAGFGIAAKVVGQSGFKPFASLGLFILSVLLALLLQATYYLVRIRLRSWVRPMQLLRGTRDALAMAFSTAS